MDTNLNKNTTENLVSADTNSDDETAYNHKDTDVNEADSYFSAKQVKIIHSLIYLAPTASCRETKKLLSTIESKSIVSIYNTVFSWTKASNKEHIHYLGVVLQFPHPLMDLELLVNLKLTAQDKYMGQAIHIYFTLVDKIYKDLTEAQKLKIFYRYIFIFSSQVCLDISLFYLFSKILEKDFLGFFIGNQFFTNFPFKKEFILRFTPLLRDQTIKIGYENIGYRKLIYYCCSNDINTVRDNNTITEREQTISKSNTDKDMDSNILLEKIPSNNSIGLSPLDWVAHKWGIRVDFSIPMLFYFYDCSPLLENLAISRFQCVENLFELIKKDLEGSKLINECCICGVEEEDYVSSDDNVLGIQNNNRECDQGTEYVKCSEQECKSSGYKACEQNKISSDLESTQNTNDVNEHYSIATGENTVVTGEGGIKDYETNSVIFKEPYKSEYKNNLQSILYEKVEGCLAAKDQIHQSAINFNTTGLLSPEIDIFFIRLLPSVDIKVLGSFLCKKENSEIFLKFTQSFDFYDMNLLEALRYFLASFTLPGESQIIFRVIEIFSNVYVSQNFKRKFFNPTNFFQKKIFSTEDLTEYKEKIKKVSYGFIVLNTMLFNPSFDKKPSFEDYLKLEEFNENYYCDNENDYFSFQLDDLKEFYENIKENEMKIPLIWNDSYDKYLLFKNYLTNYKGFFPFEKSSIAKEVRCRSCTENKRSHKQSNQEGHSINNSDTVGNSYIKEDSQVYDSIKITEAVLNCTIEENGYKNAFTKSIPENVSVCCMAEKEDPVTKIHAFDNMTDCFNKETANIPEKSAVNVKNVNHLSYKDNTNAFTEQSNCSCKTNLGVCYHCVKVCYQHLFKLSASSFSFLSPVHYFEICNLLGLYKEFRNYIICTRKDPTKCLEAVKLFIENAIADDAVVTIFLENIEKLKPKNSALPDFKSIFLRSSNEVNKQQRSSTITEIKSMFSRSSNDINKSNSSINSNLLYDVCNLQFINKQICKNNLKIIFNQISEKNQQLWLIFNKIVLANSELVEDFSAYDFNLQLDVLSENLDKNFNVVSDEVKLKFLSLEFTKGNLSEKFYRAFKHISIVNLDSFTCFCLLQQKFDDFEDYVKVEKIENTSTHYFQVTDTYENYMTSTENIRNLFNHSNSILNLKFAKKIHKDCCPLKTTAFKDFNKLIYLLLKCNNTDKLLIEYATGVLHYLSDSLILIVEIYEYIYPVFFQISKEFYTALIKILVKRIKLFLDNGVACCEESIDPYISYKTKKLVRRLSDDKLLDLKAFPELGKSKAENFEL